MTAIYLKSLGSLVLVIGLLYVSLKLIQRYTKFGSYSYAHGIKPSSISIKSIAYIDPGSKLVNFECNNKNYIVLIGKNTNILLDKYENITN